MVAAAGAGTDSWLVSEFYNLSKVSSLVLNSAIAEASSLS